MDKKFWSEDEEKLFEEAWLSSAYARSDLKRIFQRSWNALTHKARRMELPTRSRIEALTRVKRIEEMLEEDHVI